ncbi:MAG TPA: ATP-binding protein [Jatrophihabitantaceae bacterium]|jgi:signal transduction histidine kinase
MIWPRFRWLGEWWGARSLRARITIAASTLFAIAVVTGTVVLITVLQGSLIRALDSSASKTGDDVATLVRRSGGDPPATLLAGSGVDLIQVVSANDQVVARSPLADLFVPMLDPAQLARARDGHRITINGNRASTDGQLRVSAVSVGNQSVLVGTSLGRVDQSVHLLRTVAVVGCPLAVLVMALATYWFVGRTLRPVAGLRLGAEEITAAGLADQRLPVPDAQDEVQRLAVTLNAMLDRIDAATKRQRTFVGDAAHELRSPLASLRVQLEVAERLPPEDWNAVLRDSLVDVNRLELLVDDLLATARLDEAGGALRRREMVELDVLVTRTCTAYSTARVPVTVHTAPMIVDGDPDGLRRVIVNLIDNAVRHARTGVAVAVIAGRHTAGQATVQVEVTDDGPGIPAHERQRVFDRFYRVGGSRSRESGGTGLGLPIVRDLVRAHGGTVRLADNQPGLRAIITLPIAVEPPR